MLLNPAESAHFLDGDAGARPARGKSSLTCDPSTMTSLARDAWRSVYQCYAQVDAAAAGRPLGTCEMPSTWNEFARECAVEIRQLRSQSHMPPLDGAQLHTACQARRKTAADGLPEVVWDIYAFALSLLEQGAPWPKADRLLVGRLSDKGEGPHP